MPAMPNASPKNRPGDESHFARKQILGIDDDGGKADARIRPMKTVSTGVHVGPA